MLRELAETRKYVASQYAKVCLTTMVNLLDLSPKCAELDFWIFGFFYFSFDRAYIYRVSHIEMCDCKWL